MAPGLFEDSSPSPTLAFVELLRALVLSGTQPRLVGSLVWRQQTRPRPPSNATFKPTIVALSTRGRHLPSTRRDTPIQSRYHPSETPARAAQHPLDRTSQLLERYQDTAVRLARRCMLGRRADPAGAGPSGVELLLV